MIISEKRKWNDYGKSRLLSRNRLLLQHHRLLTREFLDFFRNLGVNVGVLDVGCGDGFFMELLRGLGFENLLGIDPSRSMVEKAKKKGLNVELKDVYGLNEKNKYDIVLLMDVLEHLEKPEEALRKLWDILAPNGILYLNIPICDSLALRCWRLITLTSREELVLGWDETHTNAYSKKELSSLLRKIGFSVIKSQRISNRFPLVGRMSLKLSEFLQQFTVFGFFGDLLTIIAKKE